jgi:hypothetical protein
LKGLQRVLDAARPAEEARDAAEAERLEVLWAGIEPGATVALTEAAHAGRGGLLLTDDLGQAQTQQVEIVRIEASRALVKVIAPWGASTEWMQRSELGEAVQPGLAMKAPKQAGPKFWEEG